MIKVEELIVNYKGTRALDKISLTMNQGESVALVGRNGAGKSSLLKSICGIIPTYSGHIETCGKIGWMPENGYLEDNLKVFEHLEHVSYLKGIQKSKIRSEVARVLEICELIPKKGSYCKKLSKGEMQRIHLASAIINSPDILILDEPSSGLDPLFQKKMVKIINEISKDKLLVVSTHNIHEIENLASRVVVLREGKVSFDKTCDKNYSCRIFTRSNLKTVPIMSEKIGENSFISYGSNYMEISERVINWANTNGNQVIDIKRSDDWSSYYEYF